MDSLSQHYHRMVGLDEDWTIANVELDTDSRTLTLVLARNGLPSVLSVMTLGHFRREFSALAAGLGPGSGD